ncbi:MAG TPA: response regulator transcription factor [Puia sp.]|jgi:DNA-binding NarL/FixJ family response regulator|nr:response regulator transcription factor [Puia sp.]
MIQVAIVEDIREIREGLQMLINFSDSFNCSQVYASGEDALKGLPTENPDVVLMDINLPGMTGVECVRRVKPLCPATQFIMSTVYEDDENVFESLKASATGYLLKKTVPARILEAIAEVHQGGSPMSTQIARRIIVTFQKKDGIAAADELTSREKEILKSLSEGLRYKEIAARFRISMDTVRSHARNIYEKLQVQSRTEALNKVYGKDRRV